VAHAFGERLTGQAGHIAPMLELGDECRDQFGTAVRVVLGHRCPTLARRPLRATLPQPTQNDPGRSFWVVWVVGFGVVGVTCPQ
jgi:hypothetical protein